jgi:prepilin peptidase CpaA
VGGTLPIPISVVLVAVLVTAVTDVWRFKIHNVLTVPLLLSGLIYHAATAGSIGFAVSLLGALFGFGLLILWYLLGGMGAGDVKLMAGIGAWLGLPLTFYVFIASSLAAGAYALVLILMYQRTGETWVNLQIAWHRLTAVGRYLGAEERVEREVTRPDRRQRIIPFAAMVALGIVGLLTWMWFLDKH